ncbi:MAG TPA: hypothetical protein VGK71_08915 [Nitrospirota bacterium]
MNILKGRVWTTRIFTAVLLALTLGLFAYEFLQVRETTDDTFISLRYAKNFIEGRGLTYNPGERVEGYSNFLWVMLTGTLMKFGVEPVLSAKVLGMVFGAGILILTWFISRSLFGGRVPQIFHFVPAALLLSYRYFAYWCAQGLETPMFSFLLLAGIYFYINEEKGRNRYLWPAVFGLLSLTRPEGPLFFCLTFLHRFVISRREGRPITSDLKVALPFVYIYASYIAWRYSYYGQWLPNSYYAKSDLDGIQVSGGWRYLKEGLNTFGPQWMLVGILPVLGLFFGGKRPFSYIFSLSAATFAYIVLIGGDIQPFWRFFVHFLPVTVLAAYAGAISCTLWAKALIKTAAGQFAGVVAFSLAGAVLALVSWQFVLGTPNYTKYVNAVDKWAEVGKWIRDNTPPDALIAVTNAGATSFYSGRAAIDMLGLNDGFISHNPSYKLGKTLYEKKYNSGYVLSRMPDLIVFRFSNWPRSNCETDLFDRELFRRWYAPVNIMTRYGVYTLYARMPREAPCTASGDCAGLGRKYGFDGRASYIKQDEGYLLIAGEVGTRNPNLVNHFLTANYFMKKRMFVLAARELEMEKRLNPGFGPAYLMSNMVYARLGDGQKAIANKALFQQNCGRTAGIRDWMGNMNNFCF